MRKLEAKTEKKMQRVKMMNLMHVTQVVRVIGRLTVGMKQTPSFTLWMYHQRMPAPIVQRPLDSSEH